MLNKNKENNFKVIIIAGPTACGKSNLALDLAKKYNGIVINADSQQIYKELPILSSQPDKKSYKQISHRLYNFLEFYNKFSVSKWFKLVKMEIKEAEKKNKLPIIVGGTGMYLNTLLNGLKILPNVPINLKKKGKRLIEKIGTKKFYEDLKQENAKCVHNISPNDKVRLLRSWEIFKISNKSIYEINKSNKTERLNYYDFHKILIFPPRAEVYLNCKKRWKKMINLGAINEVKKLARKEERIKKKILIKTIGFNELKDFILKKYNIKIATEKALQATRNYAKRQYTWFRHQFPANITFKEKYEKKNKKFFLKEIQDKLLTN